MIRPFTCVCMLLAAGTGLYLYQTKHRSVMLDRDIGRTLKAAEDVRARTGVLRAEWALVSERDRLGELAQRFLDLKPLAPAQFVAMADLVHHLPPPGPATPPDMPPAPMDGPADPPEPVAAATPGPATAPAASPPQTAAQAGPRAAPPAPKPVVVATKPAPGPRAVATAAPAPIRPTTIAALRPSTPATAAPNMARIVQAAAPAQSAYVGSALGSASALGSSAFAGSALGGMRAALPPPVPITASEAAPKSNYWTGH